MRGIRTWGLVCLGGIMVVLAACEREPDPEWAQVSVAGEHAGEAAGEGRLFVVFAPADEEAPYARIGNPRAGADPFFATDVSGWSAGADDALAVSDELTGFPLSDPEAVPDGEYMVQAVYKTDFFFHEVAGPGSWLSEPVSVNWPEDRGEIELVLEEKIEDVVPRDRPHVRFVRIKSEKLSEFHDEEIHLRAAVIVPSDFDDTDEEYPVRYHIGGYGSRYTRALDLLETGTEFRDGWFDPEVPDFLMVYLDGTGPYGDPYQINSRNSGPWGDAVVEELIPHIEQSFRAIAEPEARFLDGGSTGGWASLALQVFYPEFFNGAWSFCADSPDFRHFQLVNLYEDENAFVNRHDYERPSKRDTDGEPEFSIRREIEMEKALGRGDSFTTSGQQWGAWNALYGPSDDDGKPKPVWDQETGEIDHEVVEAWREYDLSLYLDENWPDIGEDLVGKLRIWMGDMDDYYLNNGMYRFADLLEELDDPEPEAEFTWGPRQGHCWVPLTHREIFEQMQDRYEATVEEEN